MWGSTEMRPALSTVWGWGRLQGPWELHRGKTPSLEEGAGVAGCLEQEGVGLMF